MIIGPTQDGMWKPKLIMLFVTVGPVSLSFYHGKNVVGINTLALKYCYLVCTIQIIMQIFSTTIK